MLQQVYATRQGEHAATITRHLVEGGADAVQIARYAGLAGNHAYGLSAYPEAEQHYRLAVEQDEKAQASQHSQQQDRLHLAFMLERLAECTRIQGNFKEARHLFERVLEVRDDSRTLNSAEEAHRYEQTWLLAFAQRLMGSILTTMGQQEQADENFEQALVMFHGCGMRLEWARTLQSYGVALLGQQRKGETSYQQGLKRLQDACQVFRECNATFDLHRVERIPTRYTVSVIPSA